MSESPSVRVAAIQWQHQPVASFDRFADVVNGLLDRAAKAEVVVFGELFTVGLLTSLPGWQSFGMSDFARVADFTAHYLDLFTREARARDQSILAGSHLVGTSQENFNTAHLFHPDGTVTSHAKTHLFPLESESNTREGDDVTVVDLGKVKVGIAICYEAEIPELATIMARRGAELILCPSYTITTAGFWRVRHCAQARCIENQVYAVHCSTVGHIGGPVPDGVGQSSILGPCDLGFPADGVLAEARANESDVIEYTLDLGALRENRRVGAAPIFEDRLRHAAFYRRFSDDLLASEVAPN